MFHFLTDESLATVLKALLVKIALRLSIRLDIDPADLVSDLETIEVLNAIRAKPALLQALFVPSSGKLTPNSVKDTLISKPFSTIRYKFCGKITQI